MNAFRSISFVVALLVCCPGVNAQPAHINFTSLGTTDGLLSNSISAILKDRSGLMWIATNDGLNRFDGKNFVVYRHRPEDSTSLRSNEILALHEDAAGNLWVGTSGGAFSEYDRKRDCFINFPREGKSGQTHIMGTTAIIRGLCSDRKGRLWIAEYGAPNVLDPATGRLDRLGLHRYAADPSRSFSLLNIYADKEDRIWVATDYGLFRYLPETRSFRQYLHREGDDGSLRDNRVRTMCEDQRGDLWVGTEKGLCRLPAGQDRFVAYPEGPEGSAAAATISAISVDKEGYVWVGSSDGLVIIDPRSGRSVTYRPEEGNSHSLTSEGVTSIYIDPDGIYWIGTFRGGVNKYDKNLNLFDGKMGEAFRDGGVRSSVVTAFAERPDGNLWLSTDGGGLYSFDRKTDRLQRLPFVVDGRTPSPLPVLAIHRTHDGQLYAGTFNMGLLQYDPVSGRARKVRLSDRDDEPFVNSVYCIREDRSGQVWVGTNGAGICVLKEGKLCRRLLPNPVRSSDVRMPVNGFIRDIAEDAEGKIWIGSHGDGVAIYDPKTGRFKVYNQEAGSLPSDKVQAFLLDSRGRMWVGTYGGGLCVYNKKTDRFIVYSEKDGLQNTNVYSILEDGSGRIWVSTNSGISSLDVQTNVFRNFTPHNGLQNNNFCHTSALRTSDGELFFGGQQGFNYLYPTALTTNRNVPAVILTDLRVANKSVVPGKGSPLEEQVSVARKVDLAYGQNFALSFVALNYTLPDQNRYAYRLDGFDKDWISAGAQNTAYYTNLDPGDYVFRVKASNNDGVWSRGNTSIRIHVRPPFWRTIYAYIFYVLAVAGLLLYSRHLGLARVRRKFAIEEERRESRRALELDRLKLKFLTNLSHEFRTPIALIMGPVEQLLSELKGTASQDRLEMIRRNGRRLLNLVNQLLDFRKMEEQELKLQLSPGDLAGLVREVGDSFEDMGQKKNIRFRYTANVEKLYVVYDRDKIERILFNLLSNAFKFTPEGGTIELSLDAAAGGPDGRRPVSIGVADSGIGIPKAEQERIFDRFFQHPAGGEILNQGTGIGLSIVKEFVQMHGGEVRVEGDAGCGSVFTVVLLLAAAGGESAAVANGSAAGGGGEDGRDAAVVAGGQADGYVGGVGAEGRLKRRVLLVEDNEDFRFYLKDNLRRYYEVLEAENGKEGWQLALSAHPELIVSDISMPFMDGIELTRKLKADKRTGHIPVILLTALTEDAQQLEGLGTGANDYITKPFNFELLNARMKALLEWNNKLRSTYTKQIKVQVPVAEGETANEQLMLRIVGYLEAHLQDAQLSVEFLSRELGMSRSSLYAKLLELTGETPVEFIRSFRLKKAIGLLDNGSLSISQIAYEVGFTSPTYFTRAFKEKYKMLPSEYARREVKPKPNDES
ncbi:MAG: response regulator [Bacteroidetes bacterium]|nr:response regulator [Bacteroidota bacterium]